MHSPDEIQLIMEIHFGSERLHSSACMTNPAGGINSFCSSITSVMLPSFFHMSLSGDYLRDCIPVGGEDMATLRRFAPVDQPQNAASCSASKS